MVAFSSVAELAVGEAPDAPLQLNWTCEPASFVVTAKPVLLTPEFSTLEPTVDGALAEFALAEYPDARPGALVAQGASFTLTGRDAASIETRRVEPGAFTLSGVDAAIAYPSAPAAFTLTGQDVAGSATFAAGAAAFMLSPVAAGFAWPVAPAAFSLTGSAAVSGATLTAASASFVVTGRSVVFGVDLFSTLHSTEGALAEYAVAEFPAQVRFGVYAQAASFALTGQPTLALVSERAEPAAFALSGGEAAIRWAHGSASFTLAGQPAVLTPGLIVQPGAFTLSLEPAQMRWRSDGANFLLDAQPFSVETRLAAESATFTLAIERPFVGIRAAPVAFTLTGCDLGFNPALVAQPASFSLIGQDAALISIVRMYPEPAAFLLAGQDAGRAYTLGPQPGVFLLAGQATFGTSATMEPASFAWSGEAIRQIVALKLGTAQFTLLGWNVVDATGPSGDHIFLIEAQAHDGTQVRTLYLATSDFTSLPTDTPPNTYYASRVQEPGNFSRSLFASGETRGRSSVGSGDIVLTNSDPGHGETLDEGLGWGWSGRSVRIRALPAGARSLAAASTLFVGRLSKLTSTSPLERLELKLADRLADIDKPLLTTLFAGTTTSTGATAEGNADLKGKVKQWCYGVCKEIPLQAANPYDLIYLASIGGDIQSITVYDGGVALTFAGTNASLADLRAASIPAGSYRRYAGYIRLGSTPQFALSADVVEGVNAAARTAAQIAYRMLTGFGIPSSELITGAFAELDIYNDAVCGYFVPDDRTALTAVQDVLDSVGGWMVPNRDGSLVVGLYSDPETAPGLTFDVEEQSLGDSLERIDGEIPVYRVVLQYARVNMVQAEGSLAGSVSAARRAYLANEWRTVVAEDLSVKIKHLDAREITVTTYLTDEADAQAEANRLLALYKVERDRYRIRLPLSSGWAADVGLAITLVHPRLGMAAGRPFNVIGRTDDYAAERVELELWG